MAYSKYPERKMKTYSAYCEEQIAQNLSGMSKTVEKVHVVSVVYKEMSFKQKGKEGQSKGNVLKTFLRHDHINLAFKVSKVFTSKWELNRAVWIDCRLCYKTMYNASCKCHKRWKAREAYIELAYNPVITKRQREEFFFTFRIMFDLSSRNLWFLQMTLMLLYLCMFSLIWA